MKRILFHIVGLCFALVANVQAQQIIKWRGNGTTPGVIGSATAWSNPANWDTGQVPDENDIVYFDQSGTTSSCNIDANVKIYGMDLSSEITIVQGRYKLTLGPDGLLMTSGVWSGEGEMYSYGDFKIEGGTFNGSFPKLLVPKGEEFGDDCPAYAAWNNDKLNYSLGTVYDLDQNVVGKSIVFKDASETPMQTQVWHVEENRILANATLFGDHNKAIGRTLTAPLSENCMEYDGTFVYDDVPSEGYSRYAFDLPITGNDYLGEVNDPYPVNKNSALGKYYSNLNTDEEFVAETEYPYVRSYSSPIGTFQKSGAPTNTHRMGAGLESSSITIPALGELDDYISHRSEFVPETTNPSTLAFKAMKHISRDANGRETISFTLNGQVIATCLNSGIEPRISNAFKCSQQGCTAPNYIDIHVPSNLSGIQLGSALDDVDLLILDLETGLPVHGLENSGDFVNLSTIDEPGYYRISADEGRIDINVNYYYNDFTYYYYDDAGQLIATVAPEGVKDDCNSFVTTYIYDAVGRVIETANPDEGTTKYIYRTDGRIAFSQDADEAVRGEFSYTAYDRYGRALQSGRNNGAAYHFRTDQEKYHGENVAGGKQELLNIKDRISSYNDYFDFDDNMTSDEVNTYYSEFASVPSSDIGQHPVRNRNRVIQTSKVGVSDTWYQFDEWGRIEKTLTGSVDPHDGYTYEHSMNYEYNNGDLMKTIYQKGFSGAELEHNYNYDKLHRLTRVSTKRDGVALQEEAEYKYYLHGPLKRTEIAEDLQGMDYIYTAGRQLKSINHPELNGKDPGRDGYNNNFAVDAFGIQIDYFDNDYTNSQSQITNAIPNVVEQKNGLPTNISWQTRGQDKVSNYSYEYDDHYRMSEAKFGERNLALINNLEKYSVHDVQYDANGNLKQLFRNDASGLYLNQKKHDLNYLYSGGNNKLSLVKQNNNSNSFDYYYDAKGRMTTGASEYAIDYNAYDKINKYWKENKWYEFTYDERGQRIYKVIRDASSDTIESLTSYVRDINGNVISVYERDGTTIETLALKEQPIYGASNLGTIFHTVGQDPLYTYDLKDHQGTVRGTVERAFQAVKLFKEPIKLGFEEQHPRRGSTFVREGLYSNQIIYGQRSYEYELTIESDWEQVRAWVYTFADGDVQFPRFKAQIVDLDGNTISDEYILGSQSIMEDQLWHIMGYGMEELPISIEEFNTINWSDFEGYKIKFWVEQIGNNYGALWVDDLNISIKQDVKGAKILSYTDYYPYGMVMRSWTDGAFTARRNGYQGEYSETDESGLQNFELRTYDPVIGRWMSPDPMNQYHSPYVGMGNRPHFMVDPDGGVAGPAPMFGYAAKAAAGVTVGQAIAYGGIALTKSRLMMIYRQNNRSSYSSSYGAQQNMAGRAFENTFLNHMLEEGYVTSVPTKYASPSRSFHTGGKLKNVVPDAVASQRVIYSNGKVEHNAGASFYEVVDFWEVKATNRNITLSYNKYQIKGMIDVLGKRSGRAHPTLTLVTTSDVTVSQRLLNHATSKGVRVMQIKSYYNSDNQIGFSSPVLLNGPGTTTVPLKPVFSAPIFQYYDLAKP